MASPQTTQVSLGSLPRTTAVVSALVLGLSLGCIFSKDFKLHFVLIPGNTFLGEHTFWNLVTGSLVELSLLKLLAALGFLVSLGSKAEAALGTVQYAMYLVASCLVSGVIATLGSLLHYVSTQGEETYFYGSMFGTSGLLISVAIALHKTSSDSPLAFPPGLTFGNLPCVLLLVALAGEYLLSDSQDLPFAVTSFLFSWMYLRFFQTQADGTSGDRRSEFEFVTLFPSVIRPALKPLSKMFGSFFLKFDMFKNTAPAPSQSSLGPVRIASSASAPSRPRRTPGETGIADPVAERRRARALKALDQKLAEMSAKKKPVRASATGAGASAGASAGATEKSVAPPPVAPIKTPSAV